MLTVDYERLELHSGHKVLDLGVVSGGMHMNHFAEELK